MVTWTIARQLMQRTLRVPWSLLPLAALLACGGNFSTSACDDPN